MLAVNEVHLGKYDPTSQAAREVLNVQYWVVVRSHCQADGKRCTAATCSQALLPCGGVMLRRSMFSKSTLAMVSLAGSRHQPQTRRGEPVVEMWCSTLCLAVEDEKLGFVRSVNSARRPKPHVVVARGSTAGEDRYAPQQQ